MTENFITHMLYSKAIVLILVSFLVLIWTFLFFRALYLKKRLNKLSKAPSFKRKNHEFSIVLTNNKEMKKFNHKFRKKNK